MSKKYPQGRVWYYRSYTVEELCRLYEDKKLNPQTIRAWIKADGLKSFNNGRFVMIYGYVFDRFIALHNLKNKVALKDNEFSCFGCKKPVHPKDGVIQVLQHENQIFAKGICPYCESQMTRYYRMDFYQNLKKIFTLQQAQDETIVEIYSPNAYRLTQMKIQKSPLLSPKILRKSLLK